jgi:hypothetical protein
MDISAFDPDMQEELRRLFPQEIDEGDNITVSYDIAEPNFNSHSTVDILEVDNNQDIEEAVFVEDVEDMEEVVEDADDFPTNSFISLDNNNEVPTETPVEESIEDITEETQISVQYNRFKGADWFEIVQEQNVILAGLGGIGSWVSLFLSRLGPKTITLYDDDRFEAHNLSGQAFRINSLGRFKVEEAASIAIDFSNYTKSYAFNSKYTERCSTSKIMICGFDNMGARKLFYNKWKESIIPEESHEYLFIDGRLTADMFQLFCIQGNDTYVQGEYERNWLFEDKDADETDCTFRQTSHIAAMLGTYITTYFTNFCSNLSPDNFPKRIPWFMEYNSIVNTYDFKY